MSEDVNVTVVVDTVQAEAEVAALRAKADEATRRWRIDRAVIIQQVREALTLISTLWSSFRQAMTLFGQQMDPFYSALIGMVLSITSMLISSAAVLSATVLGAPLGAVIFGLAVGFQIVTLGKLLGDKAATSGLLDSMQRTIASNTAAIRGQSGLGGF